MPFQLPNYALPTYALPSTLSYSAPANVVGMQPGQSQISDSYSLSSALKGGMFDQGSSSKDWFGIDGLGKNIDTLKLGASGLQTLAGLWGALKAADVAKKQLSFTKAATNANLANQTQSYNTSIADRARARGAFEGQSQSQVADYISQNSLAKRTV